jgi:hypothetical protein
MTEQRKAISTKSQLKKSNPAHCRWASQIAAIGCIGRCKKISIGCKAASGMAVCEQFACIHRNAY